MIKHINQIKTVNVVANLLALVAEHVICGAGERHLYQVGQKAVQLDTGMRRTGKAATAENAHFHPEVAAIFLRHQVGGSL